MAPSDGQVVTLDTNVAFYALLQTEKCVRAREVIAISDFLSVQVLNEYANAAYRKAGRTWDEISGDIAALRIAAGRIVPVTDAANRTAMRLAARYQLNFYDAVMIAVALANGATTLYSEDMHRGLVIDGKLTIIDPFVEIQ